MQSASWIYFFAQKFAFFFSMEISWVSIYPFTVITPRSTLTQNGFSVRVPSINQIDLFENY